jgi:hypothetical protein
MSLFLVVILWIAVSVAVTPLVGGMMFVGGASREPDIES